MFIKRKIQSALAVFNRQGAGAIESIQPARSCKRISIFISMNADELADRVCSGLCWKSGALTANSALLKMSSISFDKAIDDLGIENKYLKRVFNLATWLITN